MHTYFASSKARSTLKTCHIRVVCVGTSQTWSLSHGMCNASDNAECSDLMNPTLQLPAYRSGIKHRLAPPLPNTCMLRHRLLAREVTPPWHTANAVAFMTRIDRPTRPSSCEVWFQLTTSGLVLSSIYPAFNICAQVTCLLPRPCLAHPPPPPHRHMASTTPHILPMSHVHQVPSKAPRFQGSRPTCVCTAICI